MKIHIPWHHIETVSGVYDYSALDPLVNYAVNEKGLKVALSPLDILEDTLQTEVSAGDEVAFVVNKNDSITSDSTKLLVRIEYD